MTASAPSSASPRRRAWLRPVLLVAAVALAYANALWTPFLFDDVGAVLRNPTIRDLASWTVLSPPADGSTTTGRPVLNLSYALNYALGGENVVGYHAANVAIHALAALALLGLLRRVLAAVDAGPLAASPGGPRPRAAWTSAERDALAWAIALCWALHPLQTESVTSIAQRTESLCGLFYLFTLYAFARGAAPGTGARPRSGALWLGLSAFSCWLAVGTKEVAVTAPLLVLLFDRTLVSGRFSAALRQRPGYYAALGAAWLPLGWLLLQGSGARGVSAGFGLGVSPWHYLLTQCEALVLYLQLAVWPHPLVFDYGTGVVREAGDVLWQGLALLGLLAATGWALVRRPALGLAGACFFLMLAPSSSVVPLVAQTMAEHRMYLPLAAVLTVAALGLARWWGPAKAAWIVVALAVVGGGLTASRNRDYRDALTIWTDTVEKYPRSARGHNNLALELRARGDLAGAGAHYAEAIRIDPHYPSAFYNWGALLLEQGALDDAIARLAAAVRLAPAHADAQLALGNALVRAGRPAESVPHYQASLAARPAADAHYNLGLAWLQLDRPADAAAQFRAALTLSPALPDAHYQLGRLAERAGDGDGALRAFRATLSLAPAHAGAHRRLGLNAARAARWPEATEHFRAALRADPADADTQANLGNALLLQGRWAEAVACYELALRLRPDDPRTREHLELARQELRRSSR